MEKSETTRLILHNLYMDDTMKFMEIGDKAREFWQEAARFFQYWRFQHAIIRPAQ